MMKPNPKFRRLIACLSCISWLLLLGLAIEAQERPRRTAVQRTVDQEIRTVINNWARAVKNRDTDALDRIYADDIAIYDYTGGFRNKRSELDILKPSDAVRTLSVTNESIRIKSFARSNAALVNAIVRMSFRAQGRDTSMAMRYMSMWEKRAGRWQLTVLQTTRLPTK